MALNLIGLVLVPVDAAIIADLDRLQVDRASQVPVHAALEEIVARRVKGEEAIIFASPRRRWSEVMEAMRAAAGAVGGGLALRFYQPNVTIDCRVRHTSGRWEICPLTREFDEGCGSKASALRKAVKEGFADIASQERTRFIDTQLARLARSAA